MSATKKSTRSPKRESVARACRCISLELSDHNPRAAGKASRNSARKVPAPPASSTTFAGRVSSPTRATASSRAVRSTGRWASLATQRSTRAGSFQSWSPSVTDVLQEPLGREGVAQVAFLGELPDAASDGGELQPLRSRRDEQRDLVVGGPRHRPPLMDVGETGEDPGLPPLARRDAGPLLRLSGDVRGDATGHPLHPGHRCSERNGVLAR